MWQKYSQKSTGVFVSGEVTACLALAWWGPKSQIQLLSKRGTRNPTGWDRRATGSPPVAAENQMRVARTPVCCSVSVKCSGFNESAFPHLEEENFWLVLLGNVLKLEGYIGQNGCLKFHLYSFCCFKENCRNVWMGQAVGWKLGELQHFSDLTDPFLGSQSSSGLGPSLCNLNIFFSRSSQFHGVSAI